MFCSRKNWFFVAVIYRQLHCLERVDCARLNSWSNPSSTSKWQASATKEFYNIDHRSNMFKYWIWNGLILLFSFKKLSFKTKSFWVSAKLKDLGCFWFNSVPKLKRSWVRLQLTFPAVYIQLEQLQSACVSACVRVSAWARACVHVSAWVRECVREGMREYVWVCVRKGESECMREIEGVRL